MSEPTPTITTFVLGGYQTNCFVVTVPGAASSRACWVVDCGYEPEELIAYLESNQLEPEALLLTHAHADHIAGVDQLLGEIGKIPIYLHPKEHRWCHEPMLNLSGIFGIPVTCTAPDHELTDGQTLTLDGTTWRVHHTPGHSPGGVCFVHEATSQAIVGDTLFAGSIGRIDFPTSSPDDMRHSIDRIMQWPDEMKIHPGHGPCTTIRRERRMNPFVIEGF